MVFEISVSVLDVWGSCRTGKRNAVRFRFTETRSSRVAQHSRGERIARKPHGTRAPSVRAQQARSRWARKLAETLLPCVLRDLLQMQALGPAQIQTPALHARDSSPNGNVQSFWAAIGTLGPTRKAHPELVASLPLVLRLPGHLSPPTPLPLRFPPSTARPGAFSADTAGRPSVSRLIRSGR